MLRQLLARTTDNVIQENQCILENGFDTQAGQIPGLSGTQHITNNSGYLIPVPSTAFIANNDCFPLKNKHTISSNNSIVSNLNILPNVPQSFIGTTTTTTNTTGNQNYNYYNSTYNNYTTNQDSIALNGGQISNNENGFYFDGNGGEFCQNYLFRNESNNNNLNNTNNHNIGISDGDWNQQYNLTFVPLNKNPSIYNGDGNFNGISQNYYQRNVGIENNNTLEINGHPKSVDDISYRNSVTSISSINSVGSTSTKQINNKPLRKPSRSIRSSQAAFSEAFKKMALLRHINNKCNNDTNYYSIDDAEIGPVRCVACLGEYPSKRSLTGHIGRNEKCREIIGRNYLDQLSQNGNKNILIADYSNDGISPICPYCDRFISHYKGNIRRHINQCLKNDKKKRCRKSKENKEEYENGCGSEKGIVMVSNNSYDGLNTTRTIECHNISNNNKQTPSFDDPFMCNLCSFLTVYKGNMKRHLMACHNYNDVIFRTGTIDLEQLHASRQGKTISPTLLTRLTKKGKKCVQITDSNDKNLPQHGNCIDNTDYQTKNYIKKRYEEKKIVQSSYSSNVSGITRKLSPGAEARIDTSVQTVIENGLSYYSTI